MTNKEKGTKAEHTFRAEKKPTIIMDATPAPVDPSLCQCQDVQRRWDGDGVVDRVDGVTFYQCGKCGKKYSA